MNYIINDVLQHTKNGRGEEVFVFPYTRYDNILGAPRFVATIENYHGVGRSFPGAPFFFYCTDTVDIDDNVVEAMLGIDLTIN